MSLIVPNSEITYNSTALDAAGGLPVSQKTILGNYVQDKDNLPLLLDRQGTGSQVYNSGVVSMSVSSGQYAICQSFKRHLYLAGKAQSSEITFNNFAPEVDVTKRVGLFSSSTTAPYNTNLDGFYLESSGGVISLVIQKNGSTIANVPQSSWNGDKLDGSGPSGITINFNNFTVMELDYLYLGGTALRLRFNIGGVFYLAHTIQNSSINNSTFVGSPVQPVRWEIRSTGGAGSLGQICASVSTGGALDVAGFPRAFDTGTTFINANTPGTTYMIAALRLNNSSAIGFGFLGTSLATTNDPYITRFILNPTFGTAPTWAALPNSGFDIATGETGNPSLTTVTGGTMLNTGFVSDQSRAGTLEANSLFQPGVSTNGNFDVLAYCAQPIGSNLDLRGGINFKTL